MSTNQSQDFFYKNNRFQQLRGFCYTAQYESVSKAARFMGLSQSSVSMQIKSLEEDMGVVLFLRYGPQISLTDNGQKLFRYVLPLVDHIENLKGFFDQHLQNEIRVDLNIAVNSTCLNFIMPSLAKQYIRANPDSYLYLHYAEQEDAVEKILSEEVDFAMLPRRPHKPFPKEIDYQALFYYKPSLITRMDHPLAGRQHLTVEEISKYELTLPDFDLRVIPNLYDVFRENNEHKKIRINFCDWETTRKYVEEDMVISISSDVIIGEADKLVATPLLHLFAPVDYGIVTRKAKVLPEKVKSFISLSKQAGKKINSWYFDSL